MSMYKLKQNSCPGRDNTSEASSWSPPQMGRKKRWQGRRTVLKGNYAVISDAVFTIVNNLVSSLCL